MAGESLNTEQLTKLVKKFGCDFSDQSKVTDVINTLKTKQKEINADEQQKGSDDDESSKGGDSRMLSELINIFETNDDGKITVEDLSTIAKNTIDGKLPLPKLNLTEQEIEEYDKASYYQKIMNHPRETLEYSRYYGLTMLSKKSSLWVKNIIPTNHIITLSYVYIYSFITKEFLIFTVPLVIFYILFIAMILLTHDIFVDHNVTIKFNDVNSLIQLIDSDENDKSKRKAVQSSLIQSYTSYYAFLLVSFINLFMYFLSDQHWILSSVCFTVSCLFVAITVRSHPRIFDLPMKVCVVVIPLSNIISHVDSFLSKSQIRIPLTTNITMAISITSVLQTIAFIIPISLAIQRSFKTKNGYYHIFLPTLLALTWSVICGVHFQNSTWYGLANSTIGWLIAVIASPIILIYIFLQFLGWMFSISFGLKVAIGFILVALLCTGYVLFHDNKDVNTTLLVAFVVTVTAILIGSVAFSSNSASLFTPLKNETISKYCQLKNSNLGGFQTQVIGRDFIGKTVSWEGHINKAVLLKVANTPLDIIANFPYFSHRWLKCLVGSKNTSASLMSNDLCSLNAYNKYTIQLYATVNCGTKELNINLFGSNKLFNVLNMKTGVAEKITFNATFTDHSSLLLTSFRIGDIVKTSEGDINVGHIMFNSLLRTFNTVMGPIFSRNEID